MAIINMIEMVNKCIKRLFYSKQSKILCSEFMKFSVWKRGVIIGSGKGRYIEQRIKVCVPGNFLGWYCMTPVIAAPVVLEIKNLSQQLQK